MSGKSRVQITFWRVVLGLLVGIGGYFSYLRFSSGLAETTALDDAFPWGLWMGFNMMCGVALGVGAFTVAALVRLLGLRRYDPIVRPAVFIGAISYLMVYLSVTYELGSPFHIWKRTVMWNPDSSMFGISWCLILSSVILALELLPSASKKRGGGIERATVRRIMVPFLVAAALVSAVHQFSLSTIFVQSPHRLHPLWHSQLIPFFFSISSVSAGLAMLTFTSFLGCRFLKQELDMRLLPGMARVTGLVLLLYLLLMVQDMQTRGVLGMIGSLNEQGVLLIIEITLGVLVPIVLVSNEAVRHSRTGLFIISYSTLIGVILNRMNVAITGMGATREVSYFPGIPELLISGFLIALSFIAYAAIARVVPAFEQTSSMPGRVRRGVPLHAKA